MVGLLGRYRRAIHCIDAVSLEHKVVILHWSMVLLTTNLVWNLVHHCSQMLCVLRRLHRWHVTIAPLHQRSVSYVMQPRGRSQCLLHITLRRAANLLEIHI